MPFMIPCENILWLMTICVLRFSCSCCCTVLFVHHCGAIEAYVSLQMLLFFVLMRLLFSRHLGVLNTSVDVAVPFFSIGFFCILCAKPSCQRSALYHCRICCSSCSAFGLSWVIYPRSSPSTLLWQGFQTMPILLQFLYFQTDLTFCFGGGGMMFWRSSHTVGKRLVSWGWDVTHPLIFTIACGPFWCQVAASCADLVTHTSPSDLATPPVFARIFMFSMW